MASLNEEQRAAFVDVLSFINDPDRKTHRMSGGAGTGKSFFISKVADDILKHKSASCPLREVAITATTNKAAAVLANSMPHRRGDIKTIYSFMNLRVQDNFSTGEQKIVPTKNWAVHYDTLIIIDEASMVNAKLMEYLDKGTSNTCKILFVGDKNQLSPVKETLSPVYAQPIPESLLIKPVRNAEQPALMRLCEQLVETVKTGKFQPIEEVKGVIDYIDGNQMKGILEREYAQEDAGKRIICYTNKNVVGYNQFVRDVRGYSEPFVEGEILTNNASAELVDKARLYTDQMVRVDQINREFLDGSLIKGYEFPMVEMEVEDVECGAQFTVTAFADPQDRQDVIKHLGANKHWEKYFRIKGNYPDLRSVAASTTHKAQGSTYDSVIVDLKDIGSCTNIEQTARLLYVACSRPKHRLYLRGQLPERYFK